MRLISLQCHITFSALSANPTIETEIRKLMSTVRSDRQLSLWSATSNAGVQRIVQDYCNDDHIQITVSLHPTDPYKRLAIMSLELTLLNLVLDAKRTALVRRQIDLAIRQLKSFRNNDTFNSLTDAMREATTYATETTHHQSETVSFLDSLSFNLEYEHERFFGVNIFPVELALVNGRVTQQMIADKQEDIG